MRWRQFANTFANTEHSWLVKAAVWDWCLCLLPDFDKVHTANSSAAQAGGRAKPANSRTCWDGGSFDFSSFLRRTNWQQVKCPYDNMQACCIRIVDSIEKVGAVDPFPCSMCTSYWVMLSCCLSWNAFRIDKLTASDAEAMISNISSDLNGGTSDVSPTSRGKVLVCTLALWLVCIRILQAHLHTCHPTHH